MAAINALYEALTGQQVVLTEQTKADDKKITNLIQQLKASQESLQPVPVTKTFNTSAFKGQSPYEYQSFQNEQTLLVQPTGIRPSPRVTAEMLDSYSLLNNGNELQSWAPIVDQPVDTDSLYTEINDFVADNLEYLSEETQKEIGKILSIIDKKDVTDVQIAQARIDFDEIKEMQEAIKMSML